MKRLCDSLRKELLRRFEDYTEIRPGVRSGKPCIIGTRITVYEVLDYLAGGMTEAELLVDFPQLTPDHIRAARDYSEADRQRRATDPSP